MSIDNDAALDWHVARVAPTREARAVAELGARGVRAFAPMRTHWRRPGNGARRRVSFLAPAAPGYVFVGLDPRFKRWVSVLGQRDVVRMLGGDKPLRLSAAAVAAARAMQEDVVCELRRAMPTGREYGVGDRVEMLEGRFEGLTARVTGLARDEARLLLRMFGAEVRASAPIWALARCEAQGV